MKKNSQLEKPNVYKKKMGSVLKPYSFCWERFLEKEERKKHENTMQKEKHVNAIRFT